MSERFKSFLQWPLWVKVAVLVSVFWALCSYLIIDSEGVFDRTAFALSLLPVVLYWGLAWIFHKSARLFNIIFLLVITLAIVFIYGLAVFNDFLTKDTTRKQAAEVSYTPKQPVDCDKLTASYKPNDKELRDVIADLDYEWCMKQRNKTK